MATEDESYSIPLVDQRTFGAGIKRRCVRFIPESTCQEHSAVSKVESTNAIAEKYLSTVLTDQDASKLLVHGRSNPKEDDDDHSEAAVEICQSCLIPKAPTQLSNKVPHEATIPHQVSLPHSYPVSSIDRRRKGFDMLQMYGWDPDEQKGLGATGSGRLYPIKIPQRNDTAGIGAKRENALESTKKVMKLDAGRVTKMEKEDKKKTERLRQLFYGDDLEKYLGSVT